MIECTFQLAEGFGGADSLFFQCFPEEQIQTLDVWVAEFHSINFDEDEVVQLTLLA